MDEYANQYSLKNKTETSIDGDLCVIHHNDTIIQTVKFDNTHLRISKTKEGDCWMTIVHKGKYFDPIQVKPSHYTALLKEVSSHIEEGFEPQEE